MPQTILAGPNAHHELENALRSAGITKYLLVCDDAYPRLSVSRNIDALPIQRVVFRGFTANPDYESVCQAVRVFRENGCNGIVAVGGGSAMDVAKCVKLFSCLDEGVHYLRQSYQGSSDIPLLVIPTTAGTGSESTHFAVIYEHGEKQSVAHHSLLPDWVFLDATVLKSLPLFQKKCTLLDALCQGIESWWSVRATDESMNHAKAAVRGIFDDMESYLDNWDDKTAQRILVAANRAGQAINISQTTAPHAMSYKITSLLGLPHGYAVALCLPKVWRYMLLHPENCVHPQGWEGLRAVFADIASEMGLRSAEAAIAFWEDMLLRLGMTRPHGLRAKELVVLTRSVNAQRLGNNPVTLSTAALHELYEQIVAQEA